MPDGFFRVATRPGLRALALPRLGALFGFDAKEVL